MCKCAGNCGCEETEKVYTSDITFDGTKFVCGNEQYAKECDSLNTVLATIFGKLCEMGGEVYYAADALSAAAGDDPAIALPSATYVIPNGADGDYEILYCVTGTLPSGTDPDYAHLEISAMLNAVAINTATDRIMDYTSEEAASSITMSVTLLISDIACVAGDVLAVYGLRQNGGVFSNGVIRITKKSS